MHQPFTPPRFLSDDGWSIVWQPQRGSCGRIIRVLGRHKGGGRGYPVPALDLRDSPGTTGNGLVAALALPDADSLALDGVLAAECAGVAGVLGDFHLLHLLTERGTVSVQGC